MAEGLSGLPAGAALARLLPHLGGEGAWPDPGEDLEAGAGGEALAAALRRRGWWAREARVEGRDLQALEVPTLLGLAAGGWVLLLAREGQDWRVEDAAGTRRIPGPDLARQSGERGLDLARALPRTGSLWRLLPPLVFRHPRSLWAIGLASLGLQVLALLSPLFTKLVMDRALPEGASSLLALVTLGMAATAVFQAWTGWLRQRTLLVLGTRVEAVLAQGFLAHLLALPYPFLSGKRLGDLLQAQAGLQAARDLGTERALGTLLDGAMATLYLVAMAAALPAPTALVVLVSCAAAAGSLGVGHLQARTRRQEVAARGREQGYLAEALQGIGTVKAAGAEGPCLARWTGLLGRVLRLGLRRQRYGLWSEVGLEGLRQGLAAAVLVWGGKLVLDDQLKVGSLMAFVQMSGAFLGAAVGVAQAWLGFLVLRPQVARVDEILAVDPEPEPPPARPGMVPAPVVLEGVWFRYGPDLPWVLKDHGLRVEAGAQHWLRAPSGFGKSTLLRLVAGLLQPQQGTLTVGGLKPAEARRQLVYLPQSVQLCGGSIQDNLALLSGGAPRRRLLDAAADSGLADLVARLPMGYGTRLPQGGGTLSGGQRQLIALTAVMASERRLLLLDEALANLDWLTRTRLLQSPWFEGRTILYASHDAGLGQ